MAEDLKRFVEHRPIVARRVGRFGKLRHWAKRNPAVATLTVMVFLLLVALSVGSTAVAWGQHQEGRIKDEQARIREIAIYGRDIRLISNQLDRGYTIGAAETLRQWKELEKESDTRGLFGFEFRYSANRCRTLAADATFSAVTNQYAARYSPDGRWLATTYFDGGLIWDVRQDEVAMPGRLR